MGQHSYSGLSALDQLLAQLDSQSPEERAMAYFYARAYLARLAQEEPDGAVRRVYQALLLLAEQEAKNEPPRLPPD